MSEQRITIILAAASVIGCVSENSIIVGNLDGQNIYDEQPTIITEAGSYSIIDANEFPSASVVVAVDDEAGEEIEETEDDVDVEDNVIDEDTDVVIMAPPARCWDDPAGCLVDLGTDYDAAILGELTQHRAGQYLSMPGDVDGNGHDDLLIGTNGAQSSYLVLGPVTGTVTLDNADGIYKNATAAVSGVGDVDWDGNPDILLGNPYAYSQEGAAYVVTSLADSDVSTSSYATHKGESIKEKAGTNLSSFTDLDGDGIAEFLVGSYGGAGSVYVVSGNQFGLNMMDSASDLALRGEFEGDQACIVSALDDIHGDGVKDFVVGAPQHNNGTGAAYFISGQENGLKSVLDAATIKVNGANAYDYFGWSVSGGGDYDGDGVPDVLVGAPGSDIGGVESGAAYVLSGYDGSTLATLTGLPGDRMGYSVSFVGDINGDGLEDVIVGAIESDIGGSNSGASFVFFGGQVGTVDQSQAKITMYGGDAGDLAGFTVAGGTDIDADGSPDFAIGSREDSTNGLAAGAVYVVLSGNL